MPVAAATMTPVPLLGALCYYKFRHRWEKTDEDQVEGDGDEADNNDEKKQSHLDLEANEAAIPQSTSSTKLLTCKGVVVKNKNGNIANGAAANGCPKA